MAACSSEIRKDNLSNTTQTYEVRAALPSWSFDSTFYAFLTDFIKYKPFEAEKKKRKSTYLSRRSPVSETGSLLLEDSQASPVCLSVKEQVSR